MRTLALTLILAIAPLAQAQHPNAGALQEQRHAMQQLNYLIGHWTGEATLTPESGPILQLAQTEIAQYKSDGTILEISGNGIAPDGTSPRSTLITITYDEDHFTYHITTNTNGRAITADLALQTNGYTWAYTDGPAKTTSTMQLNEKGDWTETTQTTIGNAPPRTTFQMLLHLQP